MDEQFLTSMAMEGIVEKIQAPKAKMVSDFFFSKRRMERASKLLMLWWSLEDGILSPWILETQNGQNRQKCKDLY